MKKAQNLSNSATVLARKWFFFLEEPLSMFGLNAILLKNPNTAEFGRKLTRFQSVWMMGGALFGLVLVAIMLFRSLGTLIVHLWKPVFIVLVTLVIWRVAIKALDGKEAKKE